MDGFGTTVRYSKPTGIGGRIILTLFFLIFLALGSFFTWMVFKDCARTIETWTWKTVDCDIVRSGVGEPDGAAERSRGFRVEVEFSYTFEGRKFTGNQFRDKPEGFSDYSKAARWVEQYRPGTRATCYVNPDTPAEAILKRRSLFSLAIVFFPLIFVTIGAGGLYFTWRRKPVQESAPKPVSDRALGPAKTGVWALALFSGIFFLVGCGLSYGFLLKPIAKIITARNWPEVPCTVISSEVETHSDSDGDTHKVNIFYRYRFNGQEHKSNRYNFIATSSSGRRAKQEIVNRHPPGRETVCYVNPNDPAEAVLQRGFTPGLWFGLIPLAFVVFGASALVYVFRSRRKLTAVLSAPDAPAIGLKWIKPGVGSETITLKPAMGRGIKFIGTLVFALFWNGIVSVFLVDIIQGWAAGRSPWGLSLFLVPFVLIGVGMIVMTGYNFLGLFNPRISLQVTPGAVPLGGELCVEWEFSGRAEALRRVRIWLEGREEATYRQGTSTSTDRSVFARLNLVDSTAPPEMRSGTSTVSIPADLMHSFASANNKIVWSLRVKGEIGLWPNVDDEFPITVLPAVRKPVLSAQ